MAITGYRKYTLDVLTGGSATGVTIPYIVPVLDSPVFTISGTQYDPTNTQYQFNSIGVTSMVTGRGYEFTVTNAPVFNGAFLNYIGDGVNYNGGGDVYKRSTNSNVSHLSDSFLTQYAPRFLTNDISGFTDVTLRDSTGYVIQSTIFLGDYSAPNDRITVNLPYIYNDKWYNVYINLRVGSACDLIVYGNTRDIYFPTINAYTEYSPSNPYNNVDNSDTGGGEGDADGSSDTISVPSLPTISALGSGLIQLYNPSAAHLASFGRWLWAGSGAGLDLEDLKKVFNDPMDMILGLSIFPVSIPSGGNDYITMGNITSTVSVPVASAQYTSRDMGTLDIKRYYNSYLDYAPYTKIQIFLPYIGIKQLNTDEVMGKTLGLKYAVDLLSGACVAHITVNGSLMYEFGGTCNAQVPLTGRDMTSVLQSLVGAVAGGAMIIGGLAAGAGAGAGAVAGATATGAVNASAIGAGLIGSARSVLGMKPTVEHASGIGGTTGYMSSQTPFLIIERPRLCHPENQEHFTGYPGFIYKVVGDCDGYTKFVNLELTNIHATQAELEELENWFINRGVRI